MAEADAPKTPVAGRSRGRVWSVRGLIVLGSLFMILGALALWINRVALDTDNYTATSAEILENPDVQEALSLYLVDQLYANVDVEAAIQQRLPPEAQGLAVPAANLLRDYAQRAAMRLFQSERFQEAWIAANRIAHANLIVVLNGDGNRDRISTAGGQVVLDAGPLVERLAGELSLPVTMSDDAGRIVILQSDQLDTAQTVTHLLDILGYVLGPLAVLCFAAAVYLARGGRREAVRACAIGLIIAGLVLAFARRLIGEYMVDALTNLPPGSDAARATWEIVTDGLADTTTTIVAIGVIGVIWAWATGTGRRAVTLRRWRAADLRDHPDRIYGAAALLMLLLIWWAPTEAFRRFWPLLTMIALGAIGIEALRRQAVAEHPDAANAGLPSLPGWPRRGGRIEDLERLARLREAGAISDAEYEAEKRALMGGQPAPE